MKNILLVHVFCIFYLNYCLSNIKGWDYINLHCRDNNNEPVDWWYMYKPPSEVIPFFELGHNFTFITPDSMGRFQLSDKHITSNSMLQYTLSPIFRPTYIDHLAVAIYDERKTTRRMPGSMARGVLMASEVGGLWIVHTVPGLIDIDSQRSSFPERESSYGHLLMCLSLDLDVINTIAHNLRQAYPQLTYLKIPKKLEPLLPGWHFLDPLLQSRAISTQEFVTQGNSIRVQVLTKPPGETQSVYEIFARSKDIVLDVYRQRNQICKKNYSVRNIRSISLKYPDGVYYLNNKTDKMQFGVSTAAHWQTLGSGPLQYWTCISNFNSEVDSNLGGEVVCVENYKIWLTFDNLKVKEPEC